MDTERLGRVLGIGARHAAKTLVGAAEAAAAPHPRGVSKAGSAPDARSDASTPVSARARESAGSAPQVLRPADGRVTAASREQSSPTPPSSNRNSEGRRGLAEGGRRFGRAVWEPAARLSGVLWLEVTGLFFGIFVLVAATAAWRLRGAVHLAPGATNAQAHTELLMAVGMLVLFGYFAASSFLAASRRSRRR